MPDLRGLLAVLVSLVAVLAGMVSGTPGTPRDPASPKPTPTTQRPAPTPKPAPVGERVIRDAYLTGYSWYDNTPPGSSAIAYPKSDGNPTVHEKAGGTGTYKDPITLAVGWHRSNGPVWPAGRRFYLPFLHKYVMVEDACGDNAQNGPCYQLDQADNGASTWLDVWVGGQGKAQSVSDSCMSRITKLHTVVYRPAQSYPVNPGDITSACAAKQFYGETVPAR